MRTEAIHNLSSTFKTNFNKQTTTKSSESFLDVLKKQNTINVSKHASQRLEKRNIPLSTKDKGALNEAAMKAKNKGAKETLIFYKNNVYLMNVKNNTLITAIDKQSMKGNVFTNIDSTVFI
jgi:flagellar operon protein